MITREKSENNTLKLNIKLSKEVWDDAVEKAYEKNKGKYNIQGFRKGKAPKKVIEKNYGDTVFFDDAFEMIASKEYNEFLKANLDLEPVSYPVVKVNKIDDNGLDAELTVDLMPEIKLGKVEGIEIKKDKVEISDEQVEKEIEKLATQGARFVETDDALALGDVAVIDFEGSVDGVKFDGGSAEDFRLELGSHSFIDGFEDQIVGAKKGDNVDVNVTFPEAYPAKELAGKPALFKVAVKNAEKKVIPEIDDKFISNTTEFENLNDYKVDLKAKLTARAESETERKAENQLIEKIVEDAVINLPASMVNSEIERLIDQMRQQLSYQQLTLDQYFEFTKTTLEDLKNAKKAEAEKSLKSRLVLQKIVKDNKIEVTEEDFNAKVATLASQSGKSTEELLGAISDYEKAYIENDVVMIKLFDLLKSKNTIK